jgi:hypothetical protein
MLQASRRVWLVFVTLASFQLLAQAQGKEHPMEVPDFLSHDTDRWSFHLLQRGGPKDASVLLAERSLRGTLAEAP